MKSFIRSSWKQVRVAAAGVFVLMGMPAFATDYVWTDSSADTLWSTATNWSPNGTPGSGDNIVTPTSFIKMDLNGNRQVTDFTYNSASSWEMYESLMAGTLTINGTLTKSGTGTLTFRNSGNHLGLSVGAVSLSQGTLNFGNAAGGAAQNPLDSFTAGSVTLTGGALNFRVTGTATITGNLTMGNGSTTTIRVITAAGETGTLSVGGLQSGTGTSTLEGNSATSTTIATSLIIAGTNGTATYGGLIKNGTSTGPGSTLTLSKTGGNTQIFSSANTYSGGTTLSGGILYANSPTGSSTGTGAVTVNTGGTLAGLGHIAPLGSNGIIVNGGSLTAGGVQPIAGPGAVANGSLTLDTTSSTSGATVLSLTNATLTFALGAGSATSGSQIIIGATNASTVNFNHSTNVVSINDLVGSGLTLGSEYTLIDGTVNTTFSNLDLGAIVAGKGQLILGGLSLLAAHTPGNDFANLYGGSQLYLNGGDVVVDVEAAVPEPGTWALLLGGVGVLGLMRRRVSI